MVWAAVAAAAETVVTGAMSADAARKSGHQQQDAARAAAAESAALRQPYVEAGTGALQTITEGVKPGGQFVKPFSMADATNSEAEKAALAGGTEAIQRSAASKGGLLSTNTLAGLTQFGAKAAAGYEGEAFNQYTTQQQNALAANQQLMNTGLQATNQTADVNASARLAAGGAQAASTVGQANAWGNMLGGLTDILGQSGVGTPGTTSPGAGAAPTGGTGLVPSGSESGGMYSLSDENAKEDIERVGATHDGLPIYTYRMRGGGPKQMGVMAQDVEKRRPDAVARHPSGLRMVDYGKVS
jgi:hypothetical protein